MWWKYTEGSALYWNWKMKQSGVPRAKAAIQKYLRFIRARPLGLRLLLFLAALARPFFFPPFGLRLTTDGRSMVSCPTGDLHSDCFRNFFCSPFGLRDGIGLVGYALA